MDWLDQAGAWIALEVVRRGVWYVLVGLVCAAMGVIGTLMFGRNYKRRIADLKDRLESLQEERGDQIATNVALEARLSLLERMRDTALPAPAPLPPQSPVDPLADLRADWRASPGAGKLAAKLIAKTPTLENAREVYSGFRAPPRRSDAVWANWAILYRMEQAGLGEEVFDLAHELAGNGEEIILDGEGRKEFELWLNEMDNDG